MSRIAVIGGGAAGVAAAWKLANAGVGVTLFESSPDIGGRARSEELDGCFVDTGAQLFGSGFSSLFRIAREAGAESLLVRAPGRDGVFRGGRAHPITYGSVASMVTSSALPTGLKLKLATRYVPFLLRQPSLLDANDPAATGGAALDTESVAEWGQREVGSDFVEMLAAPLLGAYYGAAPERVSAALYHALAKAGLDVSVYAVRGGTGALLRAIADAAQNRGAEIRMQTEVTKVSPEGGRFRVAAGDEALEFDGVICTVPAPRLAGMIELPAPITTWLSAVQYAPAAVLALVLDRPVKADYFGLSLLRTDQDMSDLVAVCVPASKLPELVQRDAGLLICLGSAAANPELVEQGEQSVARMLRVVERVFPRTRERILRAKLYRHAPGYPVFYPGYLKHLRTFPVDALPPGLQLAGDYLVAPTVEGALRSGERAAGALMR